MTVSRKKLGIVFSGSFSGWVLPWITAFMVYIACLIMALGVFAHESSKNLYQQFQGTLSIIIAPQEDLPTTEKITAQLIETLEQRPNILSASPVEETVVRDLLRPWLGGGADTKGLNLPILITLKLEKFSQDNVDALKEALQTLEPAAKLDDHQFIRNRLRNFSQILQVISFLLIILVLFANVAIVILSVHNILAIYQKTIEALHLIGATDRDIINGFSRTVFLLASRGCFFGFLGALATLFLLIGATGGVSTEWVRSFSPSIIGWGLIFFVPLFMLAVIMICTEKTVLRQLEKMV